MSMFVQWGSYLHQPQEVEYTIDKQTLFTDRLTPYAELVTVSFNGQLVGSSPTDIDQKVRNLLNAYSEDGKDFRLRIEGASDAVVSINSSATNGGIRIVQRPSFPTNRQAAYVTFLPYTIRLEAEIPISDAPTLLRSFTETIQRSGGGPRYGMLEPIYGRPVRQRLKQQTVYRATQAGQAIGLYGRPLPPSAIWPRALTQARDLGINGGRRVGSGNNTIVMDFAVSWQYEFESAVPLIGNPHSWGVVT